MNRTAEQSEAMLQALLEIRAHHIELNNRQGRPLIRSKTLLICQRALDKIPEHAIPHGYVEEPYDEKGEVPGRSDGSDFGVTP